MMLQNQSPDLLPTLSLFAECSISALFVGQKKFSMHLCPKALAPRWESHQSPFNVLKGKYIQFVLMENMCCLGCNSRYKCRDCVFSIQPLNAFNQTSECLFFSFTPLFQSLPLTLPTLIKTQQCAFVYRLYIQSIWLHYNALVSVLSCKMKCIRPWVDNEFCFD